MAGRTANHGSEADHRLVAPRFRANLGGQWQLGGTRHKSKVNRLRRDTVAYQAILCSFNQAVDDQLVES